MLRSALLLLVAVLMSVQAQAFDADREAKAFVQAVDAIEPGVSFKNTPEAREADLYRQAEAKVERMFTIFALAVILRQPHYSADGSKSISGSVSLQAREEAKALLRPHTEKFARGRSLAYHDAHPGVGPLVRLVRQAPLPEKAVQSLRQMWKDMGN
ncbi:hypothetical protein A3D70_02930 [Candidatus Adlerbacteria bacterium RIFCSPHIGHO2_02_FULL_54_18]|uniref:DUF5667 domain-containing protein n=1 Tax=Candidatus Adlerbacteria bacterium RIFCSPHIGHO2_02_FULL_54_18 TaxID=1797241 RepID=A0A1F4Y389_9BACT|nr:MAG: hypothetical protein A3D70_02930 [Candidatus Adlerbacteria bacterium RIFCSPHIGHO2_02_FULL_54_18]